MASGKTKSLSSLSHVNYASGAEKITKHPHKTIVKVVLIKIDVSILRNCVLFRARFFSRRARILDAPRLEFGQICATESQ